jgi:valyl-tRNA synthetase
MIMMTMHFIKDENGQPQVPFKTVYVHGLVRDAEGQKMSKSKGNVLDPIDIIDGIDLETLVNKRTAGLMQPQMAQKIEARTRKEFPEGIAAYGTDALRFTFLSLASTGRDIKFDMGRVEGFRNFCNKLWNGTRFVLMNVEDKSLGGGNSQYSVADQWIRSRLQDCIKEFSTQVEAYRFDLASQALYDFFWNEYCDWYLELTKPVLNGDSDEKLKAGTRRTLLEVLETYLRIAHPIMPFITEEIWLRIAPMLGISGETIMLQSFPQVDDSQVSKNAEAAVAWLQQIIVTIRNMRAELNVGPSKALPLLLRRGSNADRAYTKDLNVFLNNMARLEKIEWLTDDATPPVSASGVLGALELFVPLAGVIDLDQEKQRLQKEITKLHAEVERFNSKLSNPAFVDKAPAAVVQKEREKLAEVESAKAKLSEQLQKLG